MTLKLRVRNKLEETKKGNEQASDCFFFKGQDWWDRILLVYIYVVQNEDAWEIYS